MEKFPKGMPPYPTARIYVEGLLIKKEALISDIYFIETSITRGDFIEFKKLTDARLQLSHVYKLLSSKESMDYLRSLKKQA